MAGRRSSTSSTSSRESGVLVGTPTSSSSEAVTAPESFVLPTRPRPTKKTDDASVDEPTDGGESSIKKRPTRKAKTAAVAAIAAETAAAAKKAEAAKKANQAKQTKQTKKLGEPVAGGPSAKPHGNTASSPYWLRYPEFKHDRTAALSGQFDRLANHKGWKGQRYNSERIACFAAEYQYFFHPDGWTEARSRSGRLCVLLWASRRRKVLPNARR